MPIGLGDFLPHLILMLVGGLGSSVGLGRWARGDRGQALLGKMSGATIIGFALVSFASMGGAAYWVWHRVLNAEDTAGALGSPWTLFLFGVAVGLPMSLPHVISTWNRHRPAKVAERERRAAASTRDDRAEYAERLLKQIHDATPERRTLEVLIRGDEGRVLWFEGELSRDEGERLVSALRHELSEVGFRRVEGRGPKGNWWTRV